MNRSLLLLLLALFAATAARAEASKCDQCSDLPRLYRELLDQEFLAEKFNSWVKQSYYPRSISTVKRSAANALTAAARGSLYGVLKPSGSGGGPGAGPAYGTDLNNRNCGLREYAPPDPNDAGSDEDKEPPSSPTTPEKIRAKECKPVAEAVIVHEGVHQEWCRGAYRSGKTQVLESVEEFVKNDLAAYKEGVRSLRESIADLALRCRWGGSTNPVKPDGTKTVPTPDQILKLKDNIVSKARTLRRSTK
jgi:hypothetical protein